MKRALKIIGWTIGGLLMAVVAVACIAMYVVFTPAKLTPVAREAAGKFITCQYEIGEVDLMLIVCSPLVPPSGKRGFGCFLMSKSGLTRPLQPFRRALAPLPSRGVCDRRNDFLLFHWFAFLG